MYDGKIPEGTIILDCSDCRNIIELPLLPETLQELYCTLKELPALPPSLQVLYCAGCDIPPLPQTLQRLVVYI